MKERLSWFEPATDSLRSVLTAASNTKTLVFNIKRFAEDPDILKSIGMGLAAGGLASGLSGYVATVQPRPLDAVLFNVVWIAVLGGLGISFYMRGLHR